MTGIPIESLGLILLVACVVAIGSHRLRLPYSVGLVLAGFVLAVSPFGSGLLLSRELIFTVFLPPLVFEAALQLEWPRFRRELPATVLLAFAGVVIAGSAVAAGAHYLLGWSWIGALLFGSLIAATDPVAVIAMFKEMPVPARLKLIVEAESLLNDGAAAVAFASLLAVAAGQAAGPVDLTMLLIWTVFGGVAAGAAVAGVLLVIAGRTTDHLVEITLTTLAAYGSFLFAEHFRASGILASLTAGLMVRHFGWRRAITAEGRGHVLAFWDYAAFLANSVVFILIGSHEAHQPFRFALKAVVVANVLVLTGRAISIYPLCLLLRPTSLRIPAAHQHVLFWGGLRGALALALALGLPQTIPERQDIIVAAFAVVAFSILVQGVSMPWLVKRLGLVKGQ